MWVVLRLPTIFLDEYSFYIIYMALTSEKYWNNYTLPLLINGEYSQIISFYEQAINTNPENKVNYWYLGLTLFLEGKKPEAETTWLMAMMAGDEDRVEIETLELINILEIEADRQNTQKYCFLAMQLRQQIRELMPSNITNLLKLVHLSIELEIYVPEELVELGLLDLLKDTLTTKVDTVLLIQLGRSLLTYAPLFFSSVELIKLSAPYIKTAEERRDFLNLIQWGVTEIGVGRRYYTIAIPLGEIGLSLEPEYENLLFYLASFYQNIGDSDQGIKLAQKLYPLLKGTPDKVYGQTLLVRGFMTASNYWQEASDANEQSKELITTLFSEGEVIEEYKLGALANATFFLPYFSDEPREIRQFHNQMAELCCVNLHRHYQSLIAKFQELHHQRKVTYQDEIKSDRPLRIGYISHCLKAHSVGWLARWIFEHADLQKFEIYTYMACCDPVNNPLHEWYLNKVPKYYKSNIVLKLAEKINQDEIDILIDLDSITSDVVYEVMALKPAPIQVTWLGWDASGLPTIDYYIADNYVLPADAQEYYPEKIWRLPETYLAIDGFEIAVPDLRRDQLDIPADAIVFLSAHTGYKRHPEMIKTHMKIIKGVPGSYFLIKERTDKEGIRSFYGEIAESVGLESDRLRFMPRTTFEAVHRANLGIADVVLDTYPYNGATTTMETLWMCLPMVTRVGEQFAARNSYTMMMNAGITEGIAWSDEEYIEWGIRLGKDKALRQDIACRLKASRQTAPLWNGKKFTRQMEDAYQQMWQIYLEKETTT